MRRSARLGTGDEDDQEEIKMINDIAFNYLILSCEEEISFNIIAEAITIERPDGDACLAWKRLPVKYEPKTGTSMVLLKMEFNKCALKKNQDSDEWITELERIRTRLRSLRSVIDDTDLIIHILNNLTPEYDNVVENIENRLGEDYNKIELEEVRQRLRTKHQRLNVIRNKFENEDEEKLTEDAAFFPSLERNSRVDAMYVEKLNTRVMNVQADRRTRNLIHQDSIRSKYVGIAGKQDTQLKCVTRNNEIKHNRNIE